MSSGVRLAQTVSKTVASEANGLGSTPSCSTIWRNNMNEIDEKLAKFIEEAIANSNGDYCSALDKVIKWQKKNRDLIGIHIGAPLDIMCGQRKVENPVDEANKIAHATLKMLLESARGQLKEVDVTNEAL